MYLSSTVDFWKKDQTESNFSVLPNPFYNKPRWSEKRVTFSIWTRKYQEVQNFFIGRRNNKVLKQTFSLNFFSFCSLSFGSNENFSNRHKLQAAIDVQHDIILLNLCKASPHGKH